MAILEVNNLKKVYVTRFGAQQVHALANVSFSVEKGEFVAVMGESGSGKTTLLNILATLDKPTSGEVKLNGSTVSINSLTGMLGQARFSGYASVEATAKPFVKLDLDFKKLDLETPASLESTPATTRSAAAPWSNEPIKLDGLNYVDADIKISASELNIGSMNLAPAKIESTIAGGVVRGFVSKGFTWPQRLGSAVVGAAGVPRLTSKIPVFVVTLASCRSVSWEWNARKGPVWTLFSPS